MADADNLDNLSNAELRAKMLAQGLPNIPVTDSSRKVLVKRLRASLGGNATPAATGSPKKTSNRRETLQPAPVDKTDGAATAREANAASKARRTIAVAPAAAARSDNKEAASRRQAVNKPEASQPQPRGPQAAAAAAEPIRKPVVQAAPISTRRSSNSNTNMETRRELHSERVVKQAGTIFEEPPQRKNTLMKNSLIILESDEEEDEQLAEALQHAEDQYRHKLTTARPKLTTTTTSTNEYISKPLYPTLEPMQQLQQPLYVPPSASSTARSTLGGSNLATSNLASSYSARYSSFVSPASSSYASKPAAPAPVPMTSSYRRSPPRTFANEFSDDTADDDDGASNSKYESDFARSLARLRAERIGDRSSPYRRTTAGSNLGGSYEPAVRRSLRPENESVSVSVAFQRWWVSLDRKYGLKSQLFVLFVLLLIYGAYKLFY